MDKGPILASMYPSYAHNPRVAALLENEGPIWDEEWDSKPPLCLPEDIPDLVRMASDEDLIFGETDNEWVAALLAMQELGKLRAPEAIIPIINQLRMPWFVNGIWDDLRGDEYPTILGLVGEPAIAPLHRLIANRGVFEQGRITAIVSLGCIVQQYPELREACRTTLTALLGKHRMQEPGINAFLIGYLLKMKAVESIDVIRKAYLAGTVDESVWGDLEIAEIELGLREGKPTRKEPTLPDLSDLDWMEFDDLPDDDEEYFYLTEQIRREPKIGRNDPCPCGSGRKYKKCCLGK